MCRFSQRLSFPLSIRVSCFRFLPVHHQVCDWCSVAIQFSTEPPWDSETVQIPLESCSSAILQNNILTQFLNKLIVQNYQMFFVLFCPIDITLSAGDFGVTALVGVFSSDLSFFGILLGDFPTSLSFRWLPYININTYLYTFAALQYYRKSFYWQKVYNII